MKFCRSCKRLYDDPKARCDDCGRKLYTVTDINEPVRLCVIGGTERAMLTGMLRDADIPFVEENTHPQGVANELVTGYDVKLNNISVIVPYSAVPKAQQLLLGITTLRDENAAFTDSIRADIERYRAKESEDKPMSPAMRTTVRVLSAILFLLLLAIVVLGTDKIMELIKGLFGG